MTARIAVIAIGSLICLLGLAEIATAYSTIKMLFGIGLVIWGVAMVRQVVRR